MKEIKEKIRCTQFTYGEYVIDVFETSERFDAWFRHKDNCVSTYILGIVKMQREPELDITRKKFLDMVDGCLEMVQEWYDEEFLDEYEMKGEC